MLFCCVAVVRKAYVRARYTRDLVSTPDGGTISLDWWSGSHTGYAMHETSPVVLCLHAFAGKLGVQEGALFPLPGTIVQLLTCFTALHPVHRLAAHKAAQCSAAILSPREHTTRMSAVQHVVPMNACMSLLWAREGARTLSGLCR